MWLYLSFSNSNIIPVTLPALLFNVKRKSQEVSWRVLSLALKHMQNLLHKLNKANAIRPSLKVCSGTEAASWILWQQSSEVSPDAHPQVIHCCEGTLQMELMDIIN